MSGKQKENGTKKDSDEKVQEVKFKSFVWSESRKKTESFKAFGKL